MNVRELLEELRENILRDISDAVDSDSDSFLLSDKALVRYINDAQNRFASQTLFLRDETTPTITEIDLVAGQETYALDKRVQAVHTVRTSARRRLKSTTYKFLAGQYGDFSSGTTGELCWTPSAPVYFYTDRETQRLGIYPAPSVEFVAENPKLYLQVSRLPLEPLRAENLDAEPEVPEQYHLDMLDWAAYRALLNSDIEIEQIGRANLRRNRFEDTVKRLRKERDRLLLDPPLFDLNTNWSS
ncbi:hypothetical protein [Pseudomonas mediterranea]|uniref:phage adaptor protein n=1 Tax=Pseudomonas mediterranea TaxID=183795 RepID=UPI0006D8A211|nr:hypothetical protein [Pseudomonas mediterranea]